MARPTHRQKPKVRLEIRIDPELKEKAIAAGVNFSQLMEQAIEQVLSHQKRSKAMTTIEVFVNAQPVYAGYFSGSYDRFWTDEQEAKEWASTAYSREMQLNGVVQTFQPGELAVRQGCIVRTSKGLDFVANEEDFIQCKWITAEVEI